MTDELTPAECAALCARGWMECRRKTFPNPNPGVDKLLMSQLLAIYPQPHAGADGDCPDYGSTYDPCPPGCASGVCVANTGPLPDPELPAMSDDRVEHYVFTPEQRRLELELIQAAAEWKQAREDRAMPRATELLDAVDALANYHGSLTHLQADIDQALDDFRCDGACSGNWIDPDCSWHGRPRVTQHVPESRPASQLEHEIAELVLAVAQEWLNYASLGDRDEQVRCTWHDDPEGTTLHVDSETGHGGRFLISVQAQRLPDQALADFRTPDVPGWVRRTWADVRAGDTVRLPGTEHTATVDGPPVRLPWHVHPKSGKYEATPAEWSEIRVRLAGRDGVLSMDPAGEVDILLTAAEVVAVEALGGWEYRA